MEGMVKTTGVVPNRNDARPTFIEQDILENFVNVGYVDKTVLNFVPV